MKLLWRFSSGAQFSLVLPKKYISLVPKFYSTSSSLSFLFYPIFYFSLGEHPSIFHRRARQHPHRPYYLYIIASNIVFRFSFLTTSNVIYFLLHFFFSLSPFLFFPPLVQNRSTMVMSRRERDMCADIMLSMHNLGHIMHARIFCSKSMMEHYYVNLPSGRNEPALYIFFLPLLVTCNFIF